MFKKGLLALGLFAACSSNAAMYTCKEKPNQLPCEQSAWSFEGEALYLRNEGNDIAGQLDRLVSGASRFQPDWGWGFRVGMAYHFENGKDTTVRWARYQNDNQLTQVDTPLTLYNPFGGAVIALPNGSSWRFTSRFNIVDWDFGQRIDFGEDIKLRPHVGLQWASLVEKVSHRLDQAGGNAFFDPFENDEQDSDARKLQGWGARFGLDGDYELASVASGLSLFTTNGVGLIWFDVDQFSNGRSLQAGGYTRPADFSFGLHRTSSKIIPEADINIGVKYDYAVWDGNLTAKISWDERAYFAAGVNNDNWAWGGVAFGLHWIGNA